MKLFNPRIFIGSSMEGLQTAKFVKEILKNDFECVIWNDDEVFGCNASYLDSLLKASKMFDFGILVVTKDDNIVSRNNRFDAPRDNLIFEIGFFAGSLGKFRTLILMEDGAKLPGDLSGMFISKYTGEKDFTSNTSLKKELETIRIHIQERNKLPQLGFLPSTSVALGYFNNYVGRVCHYLKQKQTEIIDTVRYSSFEVQIVIPKTLERNMQSRASDYFNSHGFIKHTFTPSHDRKIETVIAPDKKQRSKLLIGDMPTTLTPLVDAIEIYLSQGNFGKSQEQELIEARELNNFVAVLKAKINRDPFSKSIVKFVEEDSE